MSDPAAPRRILVVCLRRLGDALLTTALLATLRRGFPDAAIDVLTLRASTPALEGNADVRRVISLDERAGWRETLRAIGLRRYDLALSSLVSDRSHLVAALAAPRRVTIVPNPGEPGARWKRWLSQRWTPLDLHVTHCVIQYLRLAELLGLAPVYELAPPRPTDTAALDTLLGTGWRSRRYVVMHPAPFFPYKGWTREGWRASMAWCRAQGLEIVVTGGPAPAERAYLDELLGGLAERDGVQDLAAKLRFAELVPLLENARAFVGPDTSVTHLAAVSGAPTVALFGPSSAVTWGPWPRGFQGGGRSPWAASRPLQQAGNVWLLQGIEHCVPCLQEGCERHPQSRADCLDRLPASRVIAALEQALASMAGRV